ncbi:hypothetical protein OH77DRAFT_643063 [Trametes cingulata]|nr:hypothetical protein OH77DRAFT_643063 [Trametes cingulata]
MPFAAAGDRPWTNNSWRMFVAPQGDRACKQSGAASPAELMPRIRGAPPISRVIPAELRRGGRDGRTARLDDRCPRVGLAAAVTGASTIRSSSPTWTHAAGSLSALSIVMTCGTVPTLSAAPRQVRRRAVGFCPDSHGVSCVVGQRRRYERVRKQRRRRAERAEAGGPESY